MAVARTPLRLDPEVCDDCGRCAGVCKKGALKVGPSYILVDWSRCDGCGKCADFCDRRAIVLRDAAAGDAAPADVSRAVPVSSPKRSWLQAASARGSGAAAPDAAATQGAPVWSIPEAVLVVIVAFALLIGVQALFGGAARQPVSAGLSLLAYDAVFALLLVFLALRRRLSVATTFRLDVAPEWQSALLALALAVGTWAFSLIYRVTALALGVQPPTLEGPGLATLFGPGPFGATATVLVMVLLGPLVEEAALRGVVLGALNDRFGAWPAIIVSAFVFSLLHATAWSFLPLTVLGLSLGWLAQRSRSLLPAIAVHVAYNALFVASALYTAGRL
jgi:membrane protease YdiL (CAAX protease family)/NAD-dependent dihydropyrimidine dehydrogenase PreA subunit